MVLKEPEGLDDEGFSDIKLKFTVGFVELATCLRAGQAGRRDAEREVRRCIE